MAQNGKMAQGMWDVELDKRKRVQRVKRVLPKLLCSHQRYASFMSPYYILHYIILHYIILYYIILYYIILYYIILYCIICYPQQ